MKNAIINLWHGNIYPARFLGKDHAEIKQLENLIEENKKDLEENLGEKPKEIFEKYKACINEYLTLICEEAFCNGYCLGTKLVVEALNDTE